MSSPGMAWEVGKPRAKDTAVHTAGKFRQHYRLQSAPTPCVLLVCPPAAATDNMAGMLLSVLASHMVAQPPILIVGRAGVQSLSLSILSCCFLWLGTVVSCVAAR